MKLILFILILFLTPAYAEVSDKMSTIPDLWLQGFVVGFVLLILIRWSIYFSILGILVTLFFGVVSYETFFDPFVGPAILKEQGAPYVISSYGSTFVIFLGLIGGIYLNRVKRKKRDNVENKG